MGDGDGDRDKPGTLEAEQVQVGGARDLVLILRLCLGSIGPILVLNPKEITKFRIVSEMTWGGWARGRCREKRGQFNSEEPWQQQDLGAEWPEILGLDSQKHEAKAYPPSDPEGIWP